MSKGKNLKILNLCGQLPLSWVELFAQLQAEVLPQEQDSNYAELDYILVANEEQAQLVSKTYDALANNIKLICLGSVQNTKDFLLAGGRFVADTNCIATELGQFIIRKHIYGDHNIHLREGFEKFFSEPQDTKITNHLDVGQDFDRIGLHAFDQGFNLVSLRSYLDHAIYYFTYLKQAGLAGVPFEVEYANNQNHYCINIHASTRNFMAEYLLDSFGAINPRDPLSYLLGLMSNCCDFMEITYVENPGKLVLTALWCKSQEQRIQGLSFNNILTTDQKKMQLQRKVQVYNEQQAQSQDLQSQQQQLESKPLPGGLISLLKSPNQDSVLNSYPMESAKLVALNMEKFEETYPDRNIASITLDELTSLINTHGDQQLVNQLKPEDYSFLLDQVRKSNLNKAYTDEIERVRNGLEEQGELKKVVADSLSEEVAQRVTSHLDAETLNRILGGWEVQDNFSQKVTGLPKFELDDLQHFGIPQIDLQALNRIASTPLTTDDFMQVFGEDLDLEKLQALSVGPIDLASLRNIGATQFDLNALQKITGHKFSAEDWQNIGGGQVEAMQAQKMVDLPVALEAIQKISGEKLDTEDKVRLGLTAEQLDALTRVKGGELSNEELQEYHFEGNKAADTIQRMLGAQLPSEMLKRITSIVTNFSDLQSSPNWQQQAEDFKLQISSLAENDQDQLLQKFSNDFQREIQSFDFNFTTDSETKDHLSKLVGNVVSSIDQFGNLDNKVKQFFKEQAPEMFSSSLEQFATQLNIPVDNLTVQHLEQFCQIELPNVISGMINNQQLIQDYYSKISVGEIKFPTVSMEPIQDQTNFEIKLKQKLEDRFESLDYLVKLKKEGKFQINDELLHRPELQEVIKQTMEETIKEEYSLEGVSRSQIDQKEKEIVTGLSQSLKKNEIEVEQIVRGAADKTKEKELSLVVENLVKAEEVNPQTVVQNNGGLADYEAAELVRKLRLTEFDNKNLEKKVMALEIQVETLKQTNKQVEQINQKAGQNLVQENAAATAKMQQELNQEIEKLRQGNLAAEDAKKLAELMSSQQKYILQAQEADTNAKKLKYEMEQKEELFKSELEKVNKRVKAKELVLDQFKKSIQVRLDKKEAELKEMKEKVHMLNARVSDDSIGKLKAEMNQKMRENNTLNRTVEMYKNKLDQLSKMLNKSKDQDEVARMTDQVRTLSIQRGQLENQLNAETRKSNTYLERFSKARDSEAKLRAKVGQAESKVKEYEGQLKALREEIIKKEALGQKQVKDYEGAATKELADLKQQNLMLGSKVTELTKLLEEKSRAQNTVVAASKEVQKEKDDPGVKNLQNELSKARAQVTDSKKEITKYKAEVNALKNQLNTLKRELEKTKVPKKKAA